MICKKIEDCKKEGNNRLLTFKDKKGSGSKYVFVNNSRKTYYKIKIENCVYKNKPNDTKCDYGIIFKDEVYFIELKGSDVNKGMKQLLATIKETKKCFQKKTIKARLVVTRYPSRKHTRKRKEYVDLIEITKKNFSIQSQQFEENL